MAAPLTKNALVKAAINNLGTENIVVVRWFAYECTRIEGEIEE